MAQNYGYISQTFQIDVWTVINAHYSDLTLDIMKLFMKYVIVAIHIKNKKY